VEDLTSRGSPDAVGIVADIGDGAAVDKVFAELGERWNSELNVLINTVGPGAPGSFEALTDDQWRQSVEDGVMGMVRCVRSALPLLRKAQWARIVNFSAHSTQRQSVMLPAYTAAKAMLTSVSKNLSLLLAKDEILVNVVSPGSIATESLVGWATSVGVDGNDPYALMNAIAEHFALIGDHVSHVDADAELHGTVGGEVVVAFRHQLLHRDRRLDGADDAGKLQQETVAGMLHDLAAMVENDRVGRASMRLEGGMGPGLVGPHHARVAGDVSADDGCQASLHLSFAPELVDIRYVVGRMVSKTVISWRSRLRTQC